MAVHKPIGATAISYAQTHEIAGASRLVFVSGQIPMDEHGNVPPDFATQCRLAWANGRRQLAAADMSFDDLVKVTIFLADRKYRAENAKIRHDILQHRSPTLTIIITGIYEERWLLEIEAVAAA